MITPFRKIYTALKDLVTVQSNIENTLNSLNTTLLDGVTINVPFAGITEQNVNHKLGRNINGWIVVDKDANTDVWVTFYNDRYLTVHVEADTNIKLYIF